jgi:putative membrane protein
MASHPWRLRAWRTARPDEGEAVAPRWEAKPSAESHFAWLRTRLSVERTLRSWVRTATAPIGFGFTIGQFIERLNTTTGAAPALRPQAPRYLGLALIGKGVAALLIALGEYRWVLGYLRGPEFRAVAGLERTPWRTPMVLLRIP